MTRKPNDMTPSADPIRENGRRPVPRAATRLCRSAGAPQSRLSGGREHPIMLDPAQDGKSRQAWERLMRDNPLPAVHGRVCYHPFQ